MKRTLCRWTFVCLLAAAAGCGGDSADKIVRDQTNLANEAADAVTRITDEASAQWTADTLAKRLQLKWSLVNERRQQFTQNAGDRDKKEMSRLLKGEPFISDYKGAGDRFGKELDRVRKLSLS